MEAITIKNRREQKIAVLIEQAQNPKGLAFVMHGLGGFKEQPHIETFADAFKDNSYTVVRFDTTNSFGKSDGNYEDATTTNYYEDLEDVISWAATQDWYGEPFVLCGHSLGGISTALYTEKYPAKVKALAPISTVVSGKLSMQAPKHQKTLSKWKASGWREEKSSTVPGLVKRLKWSYMEDLLKYSLLKEVASLTMPVLLIVGEDDDSTPPEHQQILFDKLPGQKEIHIIKGAPHTFKDKKHLREVEKIMSAWINSLS